MDEHGVAEVTFHQSFIGDYLMCPARARWNAELFPDGTPPSSATAVGTAMHAGAESLLLGSPSKEQGSALVEAYDIEKNKPGFVRDMPDSEAVALARKCFKAWIRDIYPHIAGCNIEAVEQKFKVPVHYDDGFMVRFFLGGTYDAMINGVQWDWKTAASMHKYSQWKVDRHLIQPTVYTAAQAFMTDTWLPMLFKYGIVEKKREPVGHIITTTRGPREWEHLIRQIQSIYHSYGAPPVLNDTDWWCSPKWCAHWDGCKGAKSGPVGVDGVRCSAPPAPTVATPTPFDPNEVRV